MVFNGLPIILLRFAVCAVVALQHGTSHAQQYPTWTMDPNPQLGGKKEKGGRFLTKRGKKGKSKKRQPTFPLPSSTPVVPPTSVPSPIPISSLTPSTLVPIATDTPTVEPSLAGDIELQDLFAVQLNDRLFGESPNDENGSPTFPLYILTMPSEKEANIISIQTLRDQLANVGVLRANLFSEEELFEAVLAENDQSEVDSYLELSFSTSIVYAAFHPADLTTSFVGAIVCYTDQSSGIEQAYLLVIDSPEDFEAAIVDSRSLLALPPLPPLPPLPALNCPSLFGEGVNDVQTNCPNFGDGVFVDEECRDSFLSTCPAKIPGEEEQEAYNRNVQNAYNLAGEGLRALNLMKFGRYLGAVALCSRLSFPLAVATCLAAAAVKIERVAFLFKRALLLTLDEKLESARRELQRRFENARKDLINEAGACATCDADEGVQFFPTASPLDLPDPGGGWGDPHIVTFDGLQYDNQGKGEFVLMRSKALLLDIHVRYIETGFPFSFADSIVVREGGVGSPAVQLTLTETPSQFSNTVAGCNLDFYVGGNMQNLTDGPREGGDLEVSVVTGDVFISSLISGVVVKVQPRYGCRSLNTFVYLRETLYTNETDIVGLLGSPNLDPSDDWMDRNGVSLPGPSSTADAIYENAFEYCTSVWCIRHEEDSLITYGANEPTFTDFERCDSTFPGRHNLALASSEVRVLCNDSIPCLIDGLYGGLGFAQDSLDAERVVFKDRVRVPHDLPIRDSESPSSAPSESINFEGGFCGTLPFSLNGNLEPYPLYLDASEGCGLRLTPDMAVHRASSAFVPLAMVNDDFSFSMSIGYRIFGSQAGSADGMTFTMHQDPRNETALGDTGGGIGVFGIQPAFVVEWDTFPNTGVANDNSGNHIHVQFILSGGSIVEIAESAPVEIRTGPGIIGGMWVDYDGQVLRVSHNVTGRSKPRNPLLTANISLADFFSGSDVFVGYTAGTAGQADNHDIMSWSISQ